MTAKRPVDLVQAPGEAPDSEDRLDTARELCPNRRGSPFAEDFAEEIAERVGDHVMRKIDSHLAPQWPRWMTIKTAARYLDRSPRSMEYLISKKILPVVRQDRLVLLDKEDLDRMLIKSKR